MAHISPIPGSAADWVKASAEARQSASDSHHNRYLQNIASLARKSSHLFPPSTTAWGIFGINQEQGFLTRVADQIQKYLNTTMGFGWQQAFYREIDSTVAKSPKGELVAVRAPNGVGLYLERTQLWPRQQQTTPIISTASARSSSDRQGSYWAWSREHQRWAFIVQGQGQRPANEWPQVRGTTHVFCTDNQTWKLYDFDTKTWIGA